MKTIPLALVGLLAGSSAAFAQSSPSIAEQLTERGRILVGGGIGGFWVRGETRDIWRITIAPSLAYFVLDHLGVGGSIGIAGAGDSSSHSLGYSVGPDLYYDLVLGERVSLLFAFGAQVGRTTFTANETNSSSGMFSLTLGAPVMFHASESVAFGLGPEFGGYRNFGGDSALDYSESRIGVQSRIAATF